jgi:hypothetical protein
VRAGPLRALQLTPLDTIASRSRLRDLWFREVARWRLGLPKQAGNPRVEPLMRAAERAGRP